MQIFRLLTRSVFLVIVFVSGVWADSPSPYGICAHISRHGEHDLADKQLKLMNDAGIAWVRTDFDWSGVQKAKGDNWDFSMLDATVAKAAAADINILPILAYDVPWASPVYENIDQWLEYVRRTVIRYKDQLRYWEVWNEPDGAGFWYQNPNPEQYAMVLKATYAEIKKIDPDLTVLISGFSGIPFEFIEGVYKAGCAEYFDIMAVHPYRYPNTPESSYYMDDLDKLRKLMAKYGDEQKKVWITEIGWPTQKNQVKILTDVVYSGLKKLHPEKQQWSLAVFSEDGYPGRVVLNDREIKEMIPGESEAKYLDIKQLMSLTPEMYDVLVMPHDESVPYTLFDSIEKYVKDGGIVVFSQGVPLYYTAHKSENGRWKVKGADNSYKDRLHIGWEAWWTQKGVPETAKNVYAVDQFSSRIKIPRNLKPVGRFFTDKKLKGNDQFIPIVQAAQGEYTGTVAAVIDYNSDLSGAVILSSLDVNAKGVTENQQAEVLPRLYMISMQYGIDAIFWYNLRARENDRFYNEDNFGIIHKDLSPKLAYKTFKTLTQMVPAGSIANKGDWYRDGVYYPSWNRPDGKRVYSLWADKYSRAVSIDIEGKNIDVIDAYGNKLKVDMNNVVISGAPIYILGSESLKINSK